MGIDKISDIALSGDHCVMLAFDITHEILYIADSMQKDSLNVDENNFYYLDLKIVANSMGFQGKHSLKIINCQRHTDRINCTLYALQLYYAIRNMQVLLERVQTNTPLGDPIDYNATEAT